MTKTKEQLEEAIAREVRYSESLNKKIGTLTERLKNYISKEEHEKEIALLKAQYENKLTEIKNQHKRLNNERGAGRKRKATKEVIRRVMTLRAEGLSQQSIAQIVSAELGLSISRTTIGEIVRGEHNGRI